MSLLGNGDPFWNVPQINALALPALMANPIRNNVEALTLPLVGDEHGVNGTHFLHGSGNISPADWPWVWRWYLAWTSGARTGSSDEDGPTRVDGKIASLGEKLFCHRSLKRRRGRQHRYRHPRRETSLRRPTAPEPQLASPQDHAHVVFKKATQVQLEDIEQEKQTEHRAEADKKKAEVAEQRKKAAERAAICDMPKAKSRQEAVLELQRAQEQRQESRKLAGPFGILAFDEDSEPPRQVGFFGD